MIAWMFLHALGTKAIDFPESAPARQVAVGRTVYRSGAGIDRTLFDAKATLGTWFDGRIRRAVDTVTWVSPDLVARWDGYLAERDGWSDEALARRWDIARHRLEHKLTFVVRLAAFPRLDPLEFGIGAPPKPESLKAVRVRLAFTPPARRFGVRADPIVASTTGVCAAAFEKEEAAGVTGRPFFSLTDLATLFLDEGEVDSPDDGIPLGDYYGAVYLATFPLDPALRSVQSFDLTVHLATKREHATFNTFAWPWRPKERAQAED